MGTAKTEQDWLDEARQLMLRGDRAGAEALTSLALEAYPKSFELRRILAGVLAMTGRDELAETLLRQLLAERPGDAGTAFTLSRLLLGQCHNSAAARVMREFTSCAPADPELAIQAIELLDDGERKRDAAAIAEQALASHPDDARLHAYAGMLAAQLGEFERARSHYLYVLDHARRACEWHAPLALASIRRYEDAGDPDLKRFVACLDRDDLSDAARATLLFAIAKIHDDLGHYAEAAGHAARANALARTVTRWSQPEWQAGIDAALSAPPFRIRLQASAGFCPVLVVGLPRSGTTLMAELLARRPRTCNRGESPQLAELARRFGERARTKADALADAASVYMAHMQQDDASDARWFIDKQPLNLRYLDLMLAMFPDARIIHCVRGERDNALSLWMQSFREPIQGYANGFDTIASVMRDCRQLMLRWTATFGDAIRTVHYEQLVTSPNAVVGELAAWLGMPAQDGDTIAGAASGDIATASLWQARQPVYRTSIGRWRHYAPWVPELAQFAAE